MLATIELLCYKIINYDDLLPLQLITGTPMENSLQITPEPWQLLHVDCS